MSFGPRRTDLGMLLLQPARLADPLAGRRSGCSRNRWSASASCSRYVRLRWTRRSKSTCVGVELGAVHAGELGPLRGDASRQPPHMPVPSTISEFRLTTVLMPCGRVVSATACIIRGGPIASTRSICRPDCDQLLERVDHEALAAVAAVVGGDRSSSLIAPDLLLEDDQLLVAAAEDRDHVVAGLVHGLGGRVGDRRPDAAADDHDRAVGLDVRRLAQRPDQVEEGVAGARAGSAAWSSCRSPGR